METLELIRTWIVWGALAASVMLFVIAGTWQHVRDAYVRANPLARGVFAVAVIGAALYAGSKGGHISYPYTDPETRYLTDAGSYVTNNAVHVAFSRSILVPTTATFYVDYYDPAETNATGAATNITTAFSATFAARAVPFDLPFAAATNYDWIVYTDWTPPPVVHTNGVAYVAWQIGSHTNRLATTRTGIYTNAVKLAPNPAMTNLPPYAVQLTTTNED